MWILVKKISRFRQHSVSDHQSADLLGGSDCAHSMRRLRVVFCLLLTSYRFLRLEKKLWPIFQILSLGGDMCFSVYGTQLQQLFGYQNQIPLIAVHCHEKPPVKVWARPHKSFQRKFQKKISNFGFFFSFFQFFTFFLQNRSTDFDLA